MKIEDQKMTLNVKTNIDEEKEKAKELVSLLERANELIQSLKSVDEIEVDGKLTAPETILKQLVQPIRFYCKSEKEGSAEILSKSETEQKILKLLKTKRIKSVRVIYEEEPAHKCASSND